MGMPVGCKVEGELVGKLEQNLLKETALLLFKHFQLLFFLLNKIISN